MKAYFKENDKNMFFKYIKNRKIYFEWGCGGSTFQLSKKKNIKTIYSVESDLEWIKKVNSKLKNYQKNKINWIENDLNTESNTWGYPSLDCPLKKKIDYSSQILNIKEIPDIILIDGRFRVSCALKSYNIIDLETILVFDDFLNRKYYHIILEYFKIINKTKDNCMAILQKIPGKIIPEELIKKYEIDPR